MRKFLLFFIACFICSAATAQYNFYRLSIGAGAGVSKAFGDLEKNYIRPTGLVSFDYNLTPFSSLSAEIQKGMLSGGDSVNTSIDLHKRFFKNSYTSLVLSGKVQLGEFVEFERSNPVYALRGFYIGTGVGVINSKMAEISRSKLREDGSRYVFPGDDRGMELMVPVNTGISFNFVDKWGFTKFVLQFNYQMNMVFGESLDGYNDPPTIFKNNHKDFYSFTSIRFRYSFGPEGLY